MKKFKNILYTPQFARFVYHFIRLYSATFRLKLVNEDAWKRHLASGGRVLLCTWHQQFLSAIRHFKKYGPFHPALMISRSRDGELIAKVARCTDWQVARGSSSRGGADAMREMIRHINRYGLGAHILDGPRGPMGVIKPGVIRIARDTGARIFPFSVSAEQAWYARSWDRFILPKPFSRVTLRFHDPLIFDPEEGEDNFETQRQELENRMLPFLVQPNTGLGF